MGQATHEKHHMSDTPQPQTVLAAMLDARGSEEQAMIQGLLRALSIFRVIALFWAGVGVFLQREDLTRPFWAIILVALMAVTTALLTAPPGGSSILPVGRLWVLLFELAVGLIVLLGDGFVFDGDRAVSLPWSWPAAGVIAAGITYGTRAGLSSAIVAGSASLFTDVVLLDRGSGVVGAFSKLGLWGVAGTIAGYAVTRLRRAERQISLARAREEFSRELHDGVLQTLAVIQRRSSDDELAALARDQEHDLRSFIAGGSPIEASVALEPRLRSLAARHEKLYPDARVSVVVANDLPVLASSSIEALTGAVGEALTNAGKHGEAKQVTIYAEPADDGFIELPAEASAAVVFVSVKDDGSGFDPDAVEERIGLSSSIKGRLNDVGGFAAVTSAPGRGAEVTLWL